MIWVLDPNRRSHIENHSFESDRQRDRNLLDVHANDEISDGVRNDKMQS